MSMPGAVPLDRIEDIEAVVYEVLASSLGEESFSPEANFYEIGGTSLLLAIVLTQLEKRLDLEIPVGTFLENPNARDFAVRLHAMLGR